MFIPCFSTPSSLLPTPHPILGFVWSTKSIHSLRKFSAWFSSKNSTQFSKGFRIAFTWGQSRGCGRGLLGWLGQFGFMFGFGSILYAFHLNFILCHVLQCVFAYAVAGRDLFLEFCVRFGQRGNRASGILVSVSLRRLRADLNPILMKRNALRSAAPHFPFSFFFYDSSADFV